MTTNRPTPQNLPDWMKATDKRISHESRRPGAATASDLLGPGYSPTAVELQDWNQDEAVFSGQFWSDVGALNGPDAGVQWVGQVLSRDREAGVQMLAELAGAHPREYIRRFSSPPGGGTLTFTQWSLVVPNDTGLQTNLAVSFGVGIARVSITHRIINKTISFRLYLQWQDANLTADSTGNIPDTQIASIDDVTARPLDVVNGLFRSSFTSGAYQVNTDGTVAITDMHPTSVIHNGDFISVCASYPLA